MYPVLVTCPDTFELVPTGLLADGLDVLDTDNTLRDCPACGGDHGWKSAEAVLSTKRQLPHP
jgi:hypothetical protein